MNAHSEEHELLCDHLVEPRNPWDNWLATVELGGGLRATCGAVVVRDAPRFTSIRARISTTMSEHQG
ncbi:hypothetical protein SCP_0804040 [Sparassis crispa]|uniref:Uncharacterized protein n=1 Tax=Sparassis crispa TaxID=139825 RepID=A0A401GUJ6_9APHY|nr:hypothetical protein SCP_0804040 [Sparassis crispa]GBE85882.1 hypothetical protein SCP_0804040 [Sparassis crispa]